MANLPLRCFGGISVLTNKKRQAGRTVLPLFEVQYYVIFRFLSRDEPRFSRIKEALFLRIFFSGFSPYSQTLAVSMAIPRPSSEPLCNKAWAMPMVLLCMRAMRFLARADDLFGFRTGWVERKIENDVA